MLYLSSKVCPLKLNSDQAFIVAARRRMWIGPLLDVELSEPDLKLIVIFCAVGCV